jgi:hypothetical protein
VISSPLRKLTGRPTRFVSAHGLGCAAACLLSLLLILPASADEKPSAIDLDNPAQGVLADDWYAVMMRDRDGTYRKSGCGQIRIERKGDRIITYSSFELDVRRGAASVVMVAEESNTETVDAKPISFNTSMTAAKMTVQSKGTIKDGVVRMETTQAGRTTQAEYEYPRGALMAWGLMRESLRKRDSTDSHTMKAYVPSIRPDGSVELTFKYGKTETIDVFGRLTEAQRVDQTFQFGAASFDIVSWMDDDGTVLMQDMNVSFLPIRMIKCPEAIAKRPGDPPEIFTATLVELDEPINRAAVDEVAYTLRLTTPESEMPILPATGMQTPTPIDEHSVRLTVRRLNHQKLAHLDRVEPPENLARYLQSNIYVDVKDSAIQKLAAEAARDADGEKPYALADALRRFVSEQIADKNLNIGYATASEVARHMEGDCTEHAVLLTALARANGLPARAVTGLVGIPSRPGSRVADRLGYHMWTQVWIDGNWVDIDAAQRQTDCDPTHIALSIMPLTSDVVVEEELLSTLQIIGQLEVRVERAN